MSHVKATRNWKGSGKSARKEEIRTWFKCEGQVYDLTYPEMRALRRDAIKAGNSHLADTLKGLLQDVSGRWIETSTGYNLRTGNRNSQLGHGYGKTPEERKRAPKAEAPSAPKARPVGAVILRKAG